MLLLWVFFFFKQKTAYEMRISDWSSDVCSSDLLGRFGRLRIGGEDAEPDFSYVSWLSMLFAAGMGIGLVFWGAAEPVSHFLQPPEGLQPESHAAARAAMRYPFLPCGLHPVATYALIGLAMAWFQYNRGVPGLVSAPMPALIQTPHRGW